MGVLEERDADRTDRIALAGKYMCFRVSSRIFLLLIVTREQQALMSFLRWRIPRPRNFGASRMTVSEYDSGQHISENDPFSEHKLDLTRVETWDGGATHSHPGPNPSMSGVTRLGVSCCVHLLETGHVVRREAGKLQ